MKWYNRDVEISCLQMLTWLANIKFQLDSIQIEIPFEKSPRKLLESSFHCLLAQSNFRKLHLSANWLKLILDDSVIKYNNLEELNISRLIDYHLSLDHILNFFPNLINLYLFAAMELLTLNISNSHNLLKQLTLEFRPNISITMESFNNIINYLPNLTELTIENEYNDEMLQNLSKLRKLKVLNLYGGTFTTIGLNAIGKSCLELTELRLTHPSSMFDFRCMLSFQSLTLIDFATDNFSDNDVQYFENCVKLTSFTFEETTLLTSDGISILAAMFPKMKVFSIETESISNEGIIQLATKCHQLEVISLHCLVYPLLYDKSLIKISNNCLSLQVLSITGQYDEDGLIAVFQRCKQLECCNISYGTISDRLFDNIATYHNNSLLNLSIYYPLGINFTIDGIIKMCELMKNEFISINFTIKTNRFSENECLKLNNMYNNYSLKLNINRNKAIEL